MGIAVNSNWRGMVDWIGEWALPTRCQCCEMPGLPGRDLCGECHTRLPWNTAACLRCALPMTEAGLCGDCLQTPPPLDEARAALVYAAPLDRLLPVFKFHQGLCAGRLASQLMAEAAADWPRPDALVPVPLHRTRLRTRGYDQALELAKPLARLLGLPPPLRALRRTRATQAQSRLSADERNRNLRGVFSVEAGASLPAHIALVDDVMTTGATLFAAARTLREAGVARVDAWVCARVA